MQPVFDIIAKTPAEVITLKQIGLELKECSTVGLFHPKL